MILLGSLGALAIAAPALSSRGPYETDLALQFLPPSVSHLFGTDELGRDIFGRVLYGGRTSLLTAAAAVLIAGSIGIPIGLLAGYWGEWVDAVAMRMMDMVLAVPAILLAMVIIAILGRSTVSALIAVGVVSVPAFARLVRASTLRLKALEFVLATQSIGASHTYLIIRTILPNGSTPIIVQCAVTAATAVLIEAALSFLGLGTVPPEPSWGGMLSTGKAYLDQAPWYALFPGIAVTTTVFSFDLLARGMQAAFGGKAAA
jgi:peptide/nickel transport system permease protein